jgi:tetratricopeptide (TPR) repeat protein
MITRGDIRVEEWQQAIAEGNKPLAKDMWAAAEYWYAKAAGTGTLLPFAYQAWGEALLKKGKYDAAIEKFRVAYRRSPHFADPLEMWGEALMQKNRSDLALAKFEEANKYAPNWGRLHLKWGEAFFYSGHKDEAKSQFAIAAALDLNAADHAALTRQQAKF